MASHPNRSKIGVHSTLKHAPEGYYVEYTQSPNETGLEHETSCFVGPFATEVSATRHDDGGAKRIGIIVNK